MPAITVVISTFNYGRFLEEAIQSVLAQSFRDFEVIVVDGGSTDNTREVVGRFGAQLRFLQVPSRWPNRSRNAGIAAATGDFIAFLDADDKWLPQKLELQMAVARKYPDVGLIYGGMYRFESRTGALIVRHPIEKCPVGYVLRPLYFWQFVPSPTVVVPRHVFEAVGPFEEERIGSDDWEMWLRIASRYSFERVNAAVALYRMHRSQASSRDFKALDAHLDEMIKFFDTAARSYPELRELRGVRVASYLEMVGWRLVQRGSLGSGRARLRQAIAVAPLRVTPQLRLLASYFCRSRDEGGFQRAAAAYVRGKHELFNLRAEAARAFFVRAIRDSSLSDPRPVAAWVATFLGRKAVANLRSRLHQDFYCESPCSPSEEIEFEQW